MTAGLPSVVAGVGGILEVATEETALIVPPDEPGSLAKALRRLIQDPALRERLGRGARVRAGLFDAGRWVPRLEEIYARAA